MKLIKDLGMKMATGRAYRYGLFICPCCKNRVEKIKKDGLASEFCSHKCYAKNRVRRGAYNPDKKIINKKYIYVYCPEHPNAIGTKKLYVAEHRLVMEKMIGRYLTRGEVVHHKNENTIDNRECNLQLMTASEHIKYHAQNRKRNKNGKFKI